MIRHIAVIGLCLFVSIVLSFCFTRSKKEASEILIEDTVVQKDVSLVVTTFEGHQSDNQNISDNTIAVAYVGRDGLVKRFVQYMTYPYANRDKEPADKIFWDKPNHNDIIYLMDGLTIGLAERNFTYGNDWSKTYKELIEEEGHPRYTKIEGEFTEYISQFDLNEEDLPIRIYTKRHQNDSNSFESIFEEVFEYEDNKVESYSHLIKYIWPKLKYVKVKLTENKPIKIGFLYENDRLTQVNDEDSKTYNFLYDSVGKLEKLEYRLNDKIRSHRNYYYDSANFLEKIQIFNTYNELEYTIHYHYEFYE